MLADTHETLAALSPGGQAKRHARWKLLSPAGQTLVWHTVESTKRHNSSVTETRSGSVVSFLSNHQHSDLPAGRLPPTSGQRHMTPSMAHSPGSASAPSFSIGMDIAVLQVTAPLRRVEPVVGWSSITSSSVATVVQITCRICARCARPVTTVATAGGGGGSKSLRVLGPRPAGGRARISAKFQNFFLFQGEGVGWGEG
jgi:hypothetical protein